MKHLTAAVLAALLMLPGFTMAQQPRAAADDGSAALEARLRTLDSDPERAPLAAYERLRARQAIDALVAARGAQAKTDARQVAEWRVDIVEAVAATELARRETDRLDRERSELLVEAPQRMLLVGRSRDHLLGKIELLEGVPRNSRT